jgi:hypothetical protein
MEIEREGSREPEIRHYEKVREMMADVRKVAKGKGVTKITLNFPKPTIPKKRGKRRGK